jgi:hypothetical protein
MSADPSPNETVVLTGLSNREFLERYASAGRIGLSAGVTLADRVICRAQRHLDEARQWGSWSHAFVFQGRRADDQHWLMESDLQVHHKHLQLGVQEHRISKYFDEGTYTCLAVLDFGLTADQVNCVLREGLELAANRTGYSLRELVGTLVALRRAELRSRKNLLAQESSIYCSAFVQHLFRKAGVDLAPGVDLKNTTPEHIARTRAPHQLYLLQREVPRSKLETIQTDLRRRVKAIRTGKKAE